MERQDFRKELFRIALEMGCEAAETYYAASDSFGCDVLNGEVIRYAASKSGGLNLRVKVNGKDGYAFTESMEEPELLVRRAMDNANSIESTDVHPMQGKQKYATVTKRENPLLVMSIDEKVALMKRLEQITLELQPELVKRVADCSIYTGQGIIEMDNTLGLEARRSKGASMGYVGAVAQRGERVKDAYVLRFGEEVLDIEGIAKESVDEAVLMLDAAPCDTGRYDIVLRNEAVADMLQAFSDIFSAEEAQKGRSLLSDKVGQIIASESVNIVDDPFHPIAPRAFDDEGTPCITKKVIENGRLNTLLHNCKTALKAGVESTGNAVRASAASSVGVGPTVFCLCKGEDSFDELLKKLNNGLLITSISGLHAGLDPISGDFSLSAMGRLVENGVATSAVDQITVAGNFLSFMKSIQAIGNDVKPLMMGSIVTAPSILVKDISVAGK